MYTALFEEGNRKKKKNQTPNTLVCAVCTQKGAAAAVNQPNNAYIWLMAVVVIQRISVRAAHGCYIVMNTPHSRRCL